MKGITSVTGRNSFGMSRMIRSLTSLRGIFVLFIFFHHCLNLFPGGGSVGVAFFFVLGGFSMTLGYGDKVTRPDFDYQRYLLRRCIKFYPSHWFCIVLLLPCVISALNWKDLGILCLNAALLQSWIPIKGVYFSYNAVSWYLVDTMFFAVVFPFVSKWILRVKQKGLIAAALFIVCVSVASAIPSHLYHAILYISPYMRLTDFVFGIVLGLWYLELKESREWKLNLNLNFAFCQAGIILLIVLLVVESSVLTEEARLFAPVYWIPVASLILLSSLSEANGGGCNLLENKWLFRLGELSFAIYMLHPLVLRYTRLLLEMLHYEKIVYVAVSLTLTIVMSFLFDRYILKPITRWLTEKSLQYMTVRS